MDISAFFKILINHQSETVAQLNKQNDELTNQIIKKQEECQQCKEKSFDKIQETQQCCLSKVGEFYDTMRAEMKEFYNNQAAVDSDVTKSLVSMASIMQDLSHQYSTMLDKLQDIKENGGFTPGLFSIWRGPWKR